MDKANIDNGNPGVDIVPAKFQLPDAIMSTGFSTVSGDYAFYASTITEQEFGTGNNQLMKAELRDASELGAPSTFNNVWNSTYGNLYNINSIIYKVENNVAACGGQYDLLGIAQVLKVINFQVLTDMHGDIPYTEALKGSDNMNPKMDSQKDIYADLIKTIDAAIANLQKAIDGKVKSVADEDIIFKGDANKWLAAAYAVKARLYIHMTAVDASAAGEALKAAHQADNLHFAGLYISEFNGVTCDNPWSAFVWSREYTAPSTTVANLMGEDDPRLDLYTYGGGLGDCAEPGNEEAAKESATWSFPAWYDNGGQHLNLLGLPEFYFILAEAQLRASDEDATVAFRNGIAASVEEMAEGAGEELDAEGYADTFDAPTLADVFVQKYIALCYDGQAETYTDLRRCKAMGTEYIKMTNPRNTQGGKNRWPYLLPPGQSSVVSNPSLKELFGDGSYLYEKNCWLFTK